jgi:putative intracellular protease/amidase
MSIMFLDSFFHLHYGRRVKALSCSFVAMQQSKAVADGRLITGQNPQSSVAVAELVVKAL